MTSEVKKNAMDRGMATIMLRAVQVIYSLRNAVQYRISEEITEVIQEETIHGKLYTHRLGKPQKFYIS